MQNARAGWARAAATRGACARLLREGVGEGEDAVAELRRVRVDEATHALPLPDERIASVERGLDDPTLRGARVYHLAVTHVDADVRDALATPEGKHVARLERRHVLRQLLIIH